MKEVRTGQEVGVGLKCQVMEQRRLGVQIVGEATSSRMQVGE